jgi:hypothetical protein
VARHLMNQSSLRSHPHVCATDGGFLSDGTFVPLLPRMRGKDTRALCEAHQTVRFAHWYCFAASPAGARVAGQQRNSRGESMRLLARLPSTRKASGFSEDDSMVCMVFGVVGSTLDSPWMPHEGSGQDRGIGSRTSCCTCRVIPSHSLRPGLTHRSLPISLKACRARYRCAQRRCHRLHRLALSKAVPLGAQRIPHAHRHQLRTYGALSPQARKRLGLSGKPLGFTMPARTAARGRTSCT